MLQAVSTVFEMPFACKKCGVEKPFSEFPKEPRNRNGISGTCRACSNAAARERSPGRLPQRQAYRQKVKIEDPERLRGYQRAYVARNPELVAARHAKWVADNPDAVNASRQKWAANNSDKIAAASLEWAAKNPDKIVANRKAQLEKARAKTKTKRGETWGPRQTPEGRRCSGCQQRLPSSAFGKLKTSPDGLHLYCRPCMNTRAVAFNKTLEPEVKRHRGRKSSLKNRYGLTIEAYEALIESQGGRCAICRDGLSESGKLKGRNSHVDHDHETGQIRGILCRTCNVGLGHLKENTSVLQSAIDYLNRARGLT